MWRRLNFSAASHGDKITSFTRTLEGKKDLKKTLMREFFSPSLVSLEITSLDQNREASHPYQLLKTIWAI